MGFVVAAVKVAAAFVAKSAIAKTVVKLAATALISKVTTKAISKLIAKRDGAQGPAGSDAGGRVQLPPASDNKLPIVYGTAWVGGPIFDAKISTDQKYMWYCVALCEKPDGQSITFDTANGVYYGGKKVNFGINGAVASLQTNSDPVQIDNRMANKIYIWLFQNGAANAGLNTGGLNAIQIMSDASTGGGIPANERWNGPIYTSNGESVRLLNMAFAIVRVEYNPDAGSTSLDTLQIKVSNNMGGTEGCRPGTAILDYLTNERYGCAIPLENVDVTSLTNLDAYSNQFINYIDTSGNPQIQPYRYRVNGPLDTGNPCLTNLQFLADTCDSWIQYTETTGKWRIVPNKPYVGSLNSLYNVNDSVLVGGIQINPIDLNDTYNQVEVAYPNTNVKDQTDYQIVDLTDPTTAWYPIYNEVLSPNEAINRLNITLPLVNNAVQAKYLAVRRLLQSREDLVISCRLDYSGIQIDAGDVIRVNHNAYGWTNKLFRVSGVSEVQDEEGNLYAQIEAFEYNDAIYADNAIQDFIPADNTGLTDPNVISKPCTPVVTPEDDIATPVIDAFKVESCVPDTGTILYMDFNYGNNSNVQTHQLYRTVQAAGGQPFTNSDSANGYYNTISITVNDLVADTYYWSVTARNDTAGRYSDGSPAYTWGGANIQPYNPDTTRGGLPPTSYRPNSIPANAIAGGVTIAVQEGNVAVINANTLNFNSTYFDVTGSNGKANITFDGNLLISIGIGGNNFSISQGNPQGNLAGPLIPVYANANSTRNIPLILPPATGIAAYPYYEGTSSTTAGNSGYNYYSANSTGAWTPSNAAVLLIADGEDSWWMVCEDEFTQGTAAGYKTLINNTGISFVVDINASLGSQLQIVQGYKLANNSYYQCDTNAMDNFITVVPGTQYSWERVQTQLTSNANGWASAIGIATFVRNIGQEDVIVTKGTIATAVTGTIYF
jgi:hypothetical protein